MVYNMMRLAEFLFRWTGESRFADYWERNLYNGIMAQGYWDGHANATNGECHDHPMTGLLTYFLPLRGGARKFWASRTQDFFCCHGSLVQANASHTNGMYYHDDDSIAVCQYFDSVLTSEFGGQRITLEQKIDPLNGTNHTSSDSAGTQAINRLTRVYQHDPNKLAVRFRIKTDKGVRFTLKLRVPFWLKGEPVVAVNGEPVSVKADERGFLEVTRDWQDDEVYLELQKGITVCPLPGDDTRIAFLNGPIVLAGLCDEERTLYAESDQPLETLLEPDNEREWGNWKQTFRSVGQDRGIRFWPLYQIGYDRYSVYFPVKRR